MRAKEMDPALTWIMEGEGTSKSPVIVTSCPPDVGPIFDVMEWTARAVVSGLMKCMIAD